jgi:glycine cleavage system aminomethyltransferase T
MGYLPPEHARLDEELLVQYMGEQYPVKVASADSTSVFDPENTRVRS